MEVGSFIVVFHCAAPCRAIKWLVWNGTCGKSSGFPRPFGRVEKQHAVPGFKKIRARYIEIKMRVTVRLLPIKLLRR